MCYSADVDLSSVKTVSAMLRLTAYRNKHFSRAFLGVPI